MIGADQFRELGLYMRLMLALFAAYLVAQVILHGLAHFLGCGA